MYNWTPKDLEANLERGESVFLKLWKNGCGPCKLSTSAVDRLESENIHSLIFAQICTDDFPDMFEIAETEVLPVFFVFDKGKLKGKFEGFKGLERLKAFVAESLGSSKN